jgi:DNA invertase Pin-like site-specific DNA recombinase
LDSKPVVVTYIRVSTSQRGRSGLGIEAQQQSLHQFAKAEGLELGREFIEVETGKGADALDRRPQLKAALAAAKKLKCPVAVAKLDRLRPGCSFHQWPHGPPGALCGCGVGR